MKIRHIMPFRGKPGGLGDVIAMVAKPVAKVLGIKDCGGCDKRQAQLNKKFPLP